MVKQEIGNGGDKNDASTGGTSGSPNRGAGGDGTNGHCNNIHVQITVQNNSSGDKTL